MYVVPHAGTWIEIVRITRGNILDTESFPTRERGLKLNVIHDKVSEGLGRSPRGNVD